MDSKIQIEKKPVSLWNNSGEDFTLLMKVQGFEFRLDMETAFQFAYELVILGCGFDPSGYMYTSEDLDQYNFITLDLIRIDPFIQDTIYIEKQMNGCYLEFIRFNILMNQKQKLYVNLDDQECDYLYLQIIEL